MARPALAATPDPVTATVRQFYEELPFNRYERPADAAALIRRGNAIKASYPALDPLLRRLRGGRVLEIGCGTGWFANAAAYHYGARVHAVDLCTATTEAARAVGAALGTTARVTYHQLDLFDLPDAAVDAGGPYPIVNTLGVLHHTHDCRQALERVSHYVAPGGVLHVGLYHRYGRQPFLDLFTDVRATRHRPEGDAERRRLEAAAFETYRALCPASMTDLTLLRSWFRDQALHPHETQHTAEEVHGWLSTLGLECIGTSLNRYEPVDDWDAIFECERGLGALSYQRNVIEHTYYPGFFTILATRPAPGGGAA